MRLKDLFTIPKGEKVTEKHLRRVLAASICSILLCMSCLVGTTWAWFAVSIENTENVIKIGPDVMLIDQLPEDNSDPVYSGDVLSEGRHEIRVIRLGKDDSFRQQRRPVYLMLTLSDGTNSTSGYMVLDNDNETAIVYAGANEQLFWSVSWDKPNHNEVLLESGDALDIPSSVTETTTQETEAPTQPTENPTQSTEETTLPTVETTPETQS